MYSEWLDIIKSSRLFAGINAESLGIMLSCLKPRISRYKQREIVTLTGQPFEGVGIVASGKVALSKETLSGNRIIMGILEEGDIFGETIAFSGKREWPVTVIAQEDSVLLFLPPEKITGNCANICASHSTLIINMLQILSDKALMLDRKIEHISARSIRARISSYLLEMYRAGRQSSFTLPMKRHELADYLNVPRPSLSRELGAMRDDGIIEFSGSQVTVNNLLELEEAVR